MRRHSAPLNDGFAELDVRIENDPGCRRPVLGDATLSVAHPLQIWRDHDRACLLSAALPSVPISCLDLAGFIVKKEDRTTIGRDVIADERAVRAASSPHVVFRLTNGRVAQPQIMELPSTKRLMRSLKL